MRFENKTAVVTGGSRGIGLAIATKLAKEGANIAILYVGDENEGIKAKEELSQYGTKVEQYFCDVSNFEEVSNMISKVVKEAGRIERSKAAHYCKNGKGQHQPTVKHYS